jgi:hypothetical protein
MARLLRGAGCRSGDHRAAGHGRTERCPLWPGLADARITARSAQSVTDLWADQVSAVDGDATSAMMITTEDLCRAA